MAPKTFQFKRKPLRLGIIKRQNFSIPESIIYYIAKNPSTPKVYQKLIQSCKYFGQKNPILLLHCLKYSDYSNSWFTCSKIGKKSCKEINGKMCDDLYEQKIDYEIIKSQKIWITNRFEVMTPYHQEPFNIPKNIKPSEFLFHALSTKFSMEKFIQIGLSVKSCDLWDISVIKENQSTASLIEIIQCFPLLEKFVCFGNRTNSTTVKELLKLPQFLKLKSFQLGNITEEFDIETFYHTFLKKNKTMDVVLCFDYGISESYKQKVLKIINEILESNSNDFWSPYFGGPWNNELHEKLHALNYRD
uniref:DUF38 domain-containing protein n=1 Tax=Panagrolaimus davidi TaxID=227884 RepID=A0A914RAR0_9BILA